MFTNNIDYNHNNMNNALLQHGSPDGDDDDDIPFHQLVCSGDDEDDSLLEFPPSQVMSQSESEDLFEQVSPFTQQELLLALRNARPQLNRSLLDDERRTLSPKPFVTGDGLAAVAFWSHGNAVMTFGYYSIKCRWNY
jgi:hypothetical protein